MTLCVTTAYDQNYASMGNFCARTINNYAWQYGFSSAIYTDPFTERPPSWRKIKIIPELFDKDFRWVLWVDADAFFCRYDANILSITDDQADLYMVQHVVPGWTSPAPNCGVMLLRNCQWSRDLCSVLWGMPNPVRKWWENGAFLRLIGYHDLFSDGGKHEPDAVVLSRIRFISTDWNWVPGNCTSGSPIIKHYAGFKNRKSLIAKEASKYDLLSLRNT